MLRRCSHSPIGGGIQHTNNGTALAKYINFLLQNISRASSYKAVTSAFL